MTFFVPGPVIPSCTFIKRDQFSTFLFLNFILEKPTENMLLSRKYYETQNIKKGGFIVFAKKIGKTLSKIIALTFKITVIKNLNCYLIVILAVIIPYLYPFFANKK